MGNGGEVVAVNARTGNLIVQHQDELLIGRGPDIGVVRTYNSGAAFDFDNGDGWQLSLYRKLSGLTGTVNTVGSTVRRSGADGAQLTYTYDATLGRYANKDGGGAYDTLAYDDGTNTWLCTDGDTRIGETYEASPVTGEWRITRQSDPDGNALTYAYDVNGLITEISDANGETTRLVYDGTSKRLISIQVVTVDGATTRVRYSYDANGRLSAVSTDLTPADGDISDGNTYTTTYAYDGASTRLASLVNSDGTRLDVTYDTQFRVASLTDGAGKITSFAYNADNTTVTDPLGQASTLTHDSDGNLVRLQGPAGSGHDINYAYNGNGDLIRLTDGRGNIVTYAYDINGNRIRQQDGAGNVIERDYNLANQLIKETAYAVADPDGAGAGQASAPQSTHYVRDANQHLRFTVSAEGRVVEYLHNAQGQQTSSLAYSAGFFAVGATAPLEADLVAWAAAQPKTGLQRTDTTYDARGLATAITRYATTDNDGVGLADGSHSVTRYVHDSAGRLLQQIDPRGAATADIANDHLTAYAYDGLGRTISVTRYDAAGAGMPRQTLTTFNGAMNRVEMTFANGLVRLSTYDARGLLVSQVEQDGVTVLSTETRQYDAGGRLRILTDANGHQTYFLYDGTGRKTGEIDATGGFTEYFYNNAGQVIRSVRYATAVGADLAMLFAADGNGTIADVVTAAVRPAASDADQTSRAIHDAAGRLRFGIDARGYVTETRYDGTGRTLATIAYAHALNNAGGLDRLGREATPADIQFLGVAPTGDQIGLLPDSANDRVARNFYDNDGLLRGTLDGEGYLTEFRYDAAGRLIRTIRYGTASAPAERAAGTLTALIVGADANPSTNLTCFAWYNGQGQLVGSLDAEGYYTAVQYDLAGNRTRTTRFANRLVGIPSEQTAPQLVTATPGVAPSGGYVLVSSKDQVTQATWTAFNQLDSETAADGTLSKYAYDAAGKRLSTVIAQGAADSRSRQARYDQQGRLVQELAGLGSQALAALGSTPTQAQVDAVWAAYGTTHAYDAGGRRIRSTDANGNVTLFFYDAANRLTYSVRRVRNPANAAEWVGEVSARQFNALGQLAADIRYANRIAATPFAALTGGADSQIKAVGVIVADAGNDSRSDYTYLRTGELATSSVKLNATENTITTLIRDAFGAVSTRYSALDASRTRKAEYVYDRRGLLVQDQRDVVWAGNGSATGATVSTAYDAFGRAISRTDGRGIVRTAAYDKLGRQVSTVTAAGSLDLTQSASFDAFGRALTQTDPLGNVTTTAYAVDTARGTTTLTVTTPEGVVTQTVTDRYGQTLTLIDGRGNETRHGYDADGKLLTVRRWDKLAGVETLVETRNYDAVGNLLTSQDANGNDIAYSYDAANRLLTRRVDPAGLDLATTYAYDAQGRQISVTDANNVVTRTTYDLGGRAVLLVVDPDGLDLRTRYTYDLDGRRLTMVEAYGTPEARTTQVDYDSLGRRTRTVVDPGGLDLATTYAYDRNDNLVTRVEAAGTAIARTTRYGYDAADRLVYTIDALGAVLKNDHDANGRILQRTAYANALDLAGLAGDPGLAAIADLVTADPARDRTTRHVYDADGRERFAIDAIGAVTEHRYDANGNVVQRIRYANALQGTLAPGSAPQIAASAPADGAYVVTGAADRVTTSGYDAANRLSSRTEAFGTAIARTESWAYDGVGNAIRHTDARGNRTWFAYDKANRRVRTIDAAGYVTDAVWNPDGRKQSETRYVNAVALSANDDAWAYAGHAPNPVADADALSGDHTTRYAYDQAGRLLTVTDALGNLSRNAYDALGNLIDATTADGTPLASTLHRDYDALGRVIAETRAYGKTEASRTVYAYDAQGNQTTVVEAAGTAAARTTRQEFDLVGRKTAAVNGAGARSTTIYDAFGDIVKVTDALGNAGYFYNDALGRVTLRIDPEGAVVETRYDLHGNVTETTRYANKVVGTVSESARPQILDSAGSGVHVVRNDTADQRQHAFHDALGRKTEIRTWWGTGANDYYREAFTYDANGNVLSALARNGATTSYAYDALGRKIRETLPVTGRNAANADIPVENRYAYDAQGNLTQRIEACGLPEQRITAYVYDKLDRLLAETGEAITAFDPETQTDTLITPVKRRIYDAAGNLVEEIDARGQRTLHFYDALRQETGRVDAAGTYTAWTYDAAGNKTCQTIHANAVQAVGGGAIPNDTLPALVAAIPASGAYVITDAANDRSVVFSYDGAGRQTGTRIDNVTIGAYNSSVGGGTYQVSTGSLVTATVHDMLGNVVKTIDANGNITRNYFDRTGNKVGQLDAKRYLTVWIRDAAGNATQETRYANAIVDALVVGDDTPLATLLANVVPGSDDRVTVTAYDKLNRVTSETRKSVTGGTVNAGNGVLTEATADAVTTYAYDGLGNVVRKTDAIGAATDWVYDGLGRRTREQKPGYVDHLGAAVRPTTDTEYDGLNHIRREIVRGTDNAGEADDRITAYAYGAGGFLSSMTDAAGAETRYRVDANGNVTRKTLAGRGNADGSAPVDDVTLYQYDAANRQVKSTDLATGTTQEVRYNAFGEITGKRTNGGGAQVAWTEFAEYDRAGRAWKSNSGDGVAKVYVFDGNGNATLAVQSTGSELAAQDLATVLARSDTLKTISVFDARNQLTDSFQPAMEAVHELAAVQANSAGQSVFVSNDSTISVSAQSSLGGTAPVAVNPLANGGLSAIGGSSVEKVTYIESGGPPWAAPSGISAQIHIDLPNLSSLGDGNLRIRVAKTCSGAANSQTDYFFSGTQTAIDLPSIPVHFEYWDYGEWTTVSLGISIYKQTPLGELLLTQTSRGGPSYVNTEQVITNGPLAKVVRFTAQPTTASRVVMAYRPAGSTNAYTLLNVPQMTNTAGALMAGWFANDWSPLSGGNYEIQYMALDATGKILNKQSGALNLTNPAAPAVVQNNGALGPIGGFGRGLIDSTGKLNFLEQGNATGLALKYRVKGGGAAWTTLSLGNASPFGVATPGWFSLAYASYFAANTTYELEFTATNGTTVVNEARAEFSRDAAGNPSVSTFTARTQPAIVQLTERADTAYVDIDYRPLGSTGAYTTLRVNPAAAGGGRFDWDASALVPVATSNYDYDIVFKAYSAGGLLNNQTAATLRLGANAAVLSATNQNAPLVLRLTPPQTGGASIKLGYRLQGSNSDYTTLGTTQAGGEFRADLAGLAPPASGSLVYEYVYDVFDGNGALLGRNGGNFTLQAAGASASRLDWVIRNVASVSNRIHRSQATNAFGEVVRETDGLGRVTDLAYNTAGRLVRKQAPETDVTQANGYIQRLRPTTRFVYDLAGRLVATVDANGNTNTQVWLNGGAEDEIVLERHADGGLVTHGYDVFGDKRVDIDALGARTDTTFDSRGRIIEVRHPIRAAGTPGNASGVTINGNSITKTAGINNSWSSDAYSLTGLTGGAYVSAQAGQTDLFGMFGLNSDPATDRSYTSLDYAWYPAAGGNLQIYENGNYVA
ncbi:MAG: RHS repeat protein, partial [Rhodocyclales bacterium]|nr:RHS repeat protein [Rhodocyclales bacterium]